MASLFGNHQRPITPTDVEPAAPPSLHKEASLLAGSLVLGSMVLRAERTVAASQETFAAVAAKMLRS